MTECDNDDNRGCYSTKLARVELGVLCIDETVWHLLQAKVYNYISYIEYQAIVECEIS